MRKVLILATFHRFVLVDKDKPERKETYPKGMTVDASEEDAADWIAKGLAQAAD